MKLNFRNILVALLEACFITLMAMIVYALLCTRFQMHWFWYIVIYSGIAAAWDIWGPDYYVRQPSPGAGLDPEAAA